MPSARSGMRIHKCDYNFQKMAININISSLSIQNKPVITWRLNVFTLLIRITKIHKFIFASIIYIDPQLFNISLISLSLISQILISPSERIAIFKLKKTKIKLNGFVYNTVFSLWGFTFFPLGMFPKYVQFTILVSISKVNCLTQKIVRQRKI